jgi:hypothetical protein
MAQLLDDLSLISAKTLEHCNEHAVEFREGTRDHDVTQNIGALLRHIRGAPPLRLLDFGCRPGTSTASSPTPRSSMCRAAGGMGRITTLNHGARILKRRRSMNWSITIVRRVCPWSDSSGLQAYGGIGDRTSTVWSVIP